MVTKIWKFEYKIITSQLACDAVPYTHDSKTANINVKTYQFKTRCKDDMVNSVNYYYYHLMASFLGQPG